MLGAETRWRRISLQLGGRRACPTLAAIPGVSPLSTTPPACPRCGSPFPGAGACPACTDRIGPAPGPESGTGRIGRKWLLGTLASAAIAGSAYSLYRQWPEPIISAPPGGGSPMIMNTAPRPGFEPTRSPIAAAPGAAGTALILGRAVEPAGPDAPAERGLLGREVIRQAVLLAARDGLGLATRDATLGDAPAGTGPAEVLEVDSVFRAMGRSAATIRRAGAAGQDVLLDEDLSTIFNTRAGLPPLVELAERLARERIPAILKRAGFEGRPNRVRPGASVPEGVDRRLAMMVPTAQFAALRLVHAAIREDGESPARLGALVRAYANLGLLTDFHWNAAHQAFTARALLYGQRMVATDPRSPTALRHRAYARALAGLPGAALGDLEAAGRARDNAGEGPAPPWAGAIDAFCRCDLERLAAPPADPALVQLNPLLRFLVAEESGGPLQVSQGNGNSAFLGAAGRAVLAANPECFRVMDRLSRLEDIGIKHEVTVLGPAALSESLPRRLAEVPGLPAAVKRPSGGDGEPAIVRALIAAGAPADDPGEPSWAVLGSLIREARFALTRDRAEFLRFIWLVPLDEFLDEARPLVADHPYRWVIEAYNTPAGRRLAPTPEGLGIADFEATEFDYAKYQPGVPLFDEVQAHADPTARDLAFIARLSATPEGVAAFAGLLRAVSPHSPYAAAAEIELDWPKADARATDWEKAYAGHPVVLGSLARHYLAAKDPRAAARCLDRYLRLSPDLWAYQEKANLARARGDVEGWRTTLETFLEGPSTGLDKVTVRVTIARDYMARKEWAKALPYADGAAESGAGWALECASLCHEGMEDWGPAEGDIRQAAERYPAFGGEWFKFCARTGRGDVRAALRLAARDYEQAIDRLDVDGVFLLTTRLILDRRPKRALEVFRACAARNDEPGLRLHLALLADEQGDKALRDASIAAIVDGPKTKGLKTAQILKLFRTSLAAGDPAAIDLTAVDAWIAGMPVAPRGNAYYWVGRLLELHGRKDDALRYYRQGLAAPGAAAYFRVLAADALRRNGVEPSAADAEKPAPGGP